MNILSSDQTLSATPLTKRSSLAILAALALAALFALGVRTALASDPVGIYACVEQVIVDEPDGGPPLVRVYGVFSLAIRPDQNQHGWYTNPEAGYMYWRCAADQIDACRLEWRDLTKAVGTGKCAAFGQRPQRPASGSSELGRIRPYTETVQDPDVYPLAYGVSLIEPGPLPQPSQVAEFGAVCALAKAYRLTATAPPPIGPVKPGETEVIPTSLPPTELPSPEPPKPTDPGPTPTPEANSKPTPGPKGTVGPSTGSAFVPQAVGGRGGVGSSSSPSNPAQRPSSSGGTNESAQANGVAWWSGLAALMLTAATVWTWRRRFKS